MQKTNKALLIENIKKASPEHVKSHLIEIIKDLVEEEQIRAGLDNGYIDSDDEIPVLDFYIDNFMFTNFATKKEEFPRIHCEERIEEIIKKCCKNKKDCIKPKQWGLDYWRKDLTLVYWSGYSNDKKVIQLLEKIRTEITKEFKLEVGACAYTTKAYNWHTEI